MLAQNLARSGDLESFRDGFPRLTARNRLGHKARKIGAVRWGNNRFPAVLPARHDVGKLWVMNIAELIEEIKALPPAELEIVREFVLNGEARDKQPEKRYVSDEEFDKATSRVFEKHDELLRKLAQ